MRLEFHPEAEQEFLESVSRYEAEVPGLGERFDAEVQKASALLLEYPQIGPPVRRTSRRANQRRRPIPNRVFGEVGRTLGQADWTDRLGTNGGSLGL